MTSTPCSPSPPLAPEADPASETPARTGAPLCWVVDEDASLRHFLSLVLHGAGIDTVEFADGEEVRGEIGKQQPDLVFLNISLESSDAIESVIALGKAEFRGAIQLMSNRGAAVLDHVKTIGAQQKLKMLTVLKKPFETDAIVKIIRDRKLGLPGPAEGAVSLSEALSNNWIEFWYQPKIDLRKKQLAGAEAFARVRHPQHGVILPATFLPNASEDDLFKLSELVIASALKAGLNFSKLGINLSLSVNVPVTALVKLPIADLVKAHRSGSDKWPGLIIDVAEDQILKDLALADELSTKFAPSNVRLAVDDFGSGYAALAQVKELPFAEVKIDRAFVTDCGSDKVKAPICKTAIDLAHNFGSVVVAVGIEKAADAVALVSMGCDFGQGYLLGQPMPEERFISLLRQRRGAKAQASATVEEPA